MVASQLKPPKILKEPPRHTSKPRSSLGSEAPCPTLGCQCYLSAIDVRSISNAISITKGKKHNIPYMFFSYAQMVASCFSMGYGLSMCFPKMFSPGQPQGSQLPVLICHLCQLPQALEDPARPGATRRTSAPNQVPPIRRWWL